VLAKLKSALTSPRANNLRAALYTAVPVLLAGLVSGDVLTQDHANLWAALAIAVLSPAIAAKITADTFRTWFFGVLAGVQGVLVGVFGIALDGQVALWISVATSVVSSALAAANVHTEPPLSPETRANIAEVNRLAAVAGQRAGVGVAALLEQINKHDAALADPSKSWIGRLVAGIASSRPNHHDSDASDA
jgi:hypothetical protein